MAQENEGQDQAQSGRITRVSKAQKNLVLQEVLTECDRRIEEMHKDLYASRDYSDGVRFENERMKQWVLNMMES